MKYIKKNKLTVFIIIIFAIMVIVGGYLYNMLFANGRSGIYGNRLDGIEEVEITKKQYKEIKTKLKENENVVEVSTDLKGKIVNIIITVKDELEKDAAKTIASSSLEVFDKEQLKYYDIQIFVKKDNEALNDFPIIGYKQNGKEGLTWSKDRQVTSNETE